MASISMISQLKDRRLWFPSSSNCSGIESIKAFLGGDATDFGLDPDVVCVDEEVGDPVELSLDGDASKGTLEVMEAGDVPRLARVFEMMLEFVRRREAVPKSVGRLSVLMECML